MSPPPLLRSAWPLRVVWLLVPLLAGPALAGALADHSRPVQVVGSLLAWGGWAAALVAMLVPRTATLTFVRVVVPGALVAAGWSAWASDEAGWAAAGVGIGAAALVALAGPGVSDGFVDGSSYGTERRVALRVPYVLLLGPAPLAWTAVAAGVVSGPLLLAAEQWVAGAVALVVGVGLVAIGGRQIHLLSRRWLVFVPAGVVVHDPLVLTEPILVPRHLVRRIGPAEAGSTALDVTGGGLGLVLELSAIEPLTVGLRRARVREECGGVVGLLITPTQPAATLAIAADHRLPVA